MYLYDVKQLQNEYILHYLQSDIILYLFETKNIFAVCLVASMSIWSLFCWMHFLFSYTTLAIEGIALYIEGKLYSYAIYLICIDSDTCMYRSEQRRQYIDVSGNRRACKRSDDIDSKIRNVSMYLFCLFYILCLNLLSSISLCICCIRTYVCTY
jgi:hypothetical protein